MLSKYSVLLMVIPAFAFIACQQADRKSQASDLDTTNLATADSMVFSFDPEDEFLGLGIPEFGDLDSMIARRRIRALVPYTRIYYYIDGKERRGIAFEALNYFEKSLNQQLHFNPAKVRVVFIPVNRAQIIPMLNAGYADLAFAGMAITSERKELVDFSIPTISGINEVLVGGPLSPKINNLSDLSGQHVFVHEGSSYERAVKHLSDSLVLLGKPAIKIGSIDPYLEVEDILYLVNSGGIPFTVIVEDATRLWGHVLDSIKVYSEIPLTRHISYGWLFRKNSPQLKAAADQFLEKNAKGTLYGNMLYNRYVKSVKNLPDLNSKKTRDQLKALENIFKKHADTYKLDWLLLAAQGYQESDLNQQTLSRAGAVGIMQIKPSTANNPPINIADINNADNNVHAGTKYLRHLIDHYFNDPQISDLNKHLLALASYNAGPTRIAHLRKVAKAKGLDPNLWFDHVEIIVAQEVGAETVQYVSNIYKFYASYRSLKYYAEQSKKEVL